MEIDITDLKCDQCDREVDVEASFIKSSCLYGNKKTIKKVRNIINVYFSCKNCGAVPAKRGDTLYHHPKELFHRVLIEQN